MKTSFQHLLVLCINNSWRLLFQLQWTWWFWPTLLLSTFRRYESLWRNLRPDPIDREGLLSWDLEKKKKKSHGLGGTFPLQVLADSWEGYWRICWKPLLARAQLWCSGVTEKSSLVNSPSFRLKHQRISQPPLPTSARIKASQSREILPGIVMYHLIIFIFKLGKGDPG